MASGIEVVIKKNDLKKLKRAAPEKADRALAAAAHEGEAQAKLLIQTSPATGATYSRGGVRHTASSPGNPPRTDTGNLVNNIIARRLKKLLWAVTSGADYGPPLEYGTIHMAARPYMTPMAFYLEKNIGKIFDHFLGG